MSVDRTILFASLCTWRHGHTCGSVQKPLIFSEYHFPYLYILLIFEPLYLLEQGTGTPPSAIWPKTLPWPCTFFNLLTNCLRVSNHAMGMCCGPTQ
jgi:hypothetical protein